MSKGTPEVGFPFLTPSQQELAPYGFKPSQIRVKKGLFVKGGLRVVVYNRCRFAQEDLANTR